MSQCCCWLCERTRASVVDQSRTGILQSGQEMYRQNTARLSHWSPLKAMLPGFCKLACRRTGKIPGWDTFEEMLPVVERWTFWRGIVGRWSGTHAFVMHGAVRAFCTIRVLQFWIIGGMFLQVHLFYLLHLIYLITKGAIRRLVSRIIALINVL